MDRLKQLKPFAKVYVLLIAAFFFSMVLVYCIPTSWIGGNVQKSLEVMENEGERPMYAFYRHSAIVDNHTDMLMYESLLPGDEYNFIQASVSVNHYPRYWHGYQVILRPISILFQVQEVRYLGMLCFYLLFFLSAYLMAQKTNLTCAMWYVLTIASGYLGAVATCFQYLTSFYVMFVALILLLKRYDTPRAFPVSLFFFVVGMVENFFDFLTYPIITLGIPLVVLLWLRTQKEQEDLWGNLKFTVRTSAAWGFGYALAWIAKWILAAGILGVRYFWRSLDTAKYRMLGNEDEPIDRISTIRKNLKAWLNVQDEGLITWSKVVLLIVLVAVILVLIKKLKDRRVVQACLPMLLVASYPYVWFLVLSNHSQIHFWYTYRAQLVALFGVLMFVTGILKHKGGEET